MACRSMEFGGVGGGIPRCTGGEPNGGIIPCCCCCCIIIIMGGCCPTMDPSAPTVTEFCGVMGGGLGKLKAAEFWGVTGMGLGMGGGGLTGVSTAAISTVSNRFATCSTTEDGAAGGAAAALGAPIPGGGPTTMASVTLYSSALESNCWRPGGAWGVTGTT